jgi:hypothetical protein
MLAEVNQAIEGRQVTVELAYEPEWAAEHQRAVQAAALETRDACKNAPGQGIVPFGESCYETPECECGLTCQSGRCLGTSLKAKPTLAAVRSVECTAMTVGLDTTYWVERDRGARTVPTAALKKVTVVNRGVGALEGAGVGLVIGGTLGGFLNLSLSQLASQGNRPGGAGEFLAGFAVLGALTAVVLGLPVGAAVGHRTHVEFEDSEPATMARPP